MTTSSLKRKVKVPANSLQKASSLQKLRMLRTLRQQKEEKVAKQQREVTVAMHLRLMKRHLHLLKRRRLREGRLPRSLNFQSLFCGYIPWSICVFLGGVWGGGGGM